MRIRRKEKVTSENVLRKMKQERVHYANNSVRQKLAYAKRVLRGSSGSNALLALEGTFKVKKARPRLRRTRIDDLLKWT